MHLKEMIIVTTGELIKQFRKERGMTQSELAEKVGYASHAAIARIEQDGFDLLLSKVKQIAAALEVAPALLIGDEGATKAPVFSTEALQIASAFDHADEYQKNIVRATLEPQLAVQSKAG